MCIHIQQMTKHSLYSLFAFREILHKNTQGFENQIETVNGFVIIFLPGNNGASDKSFHILSR